MGTFKLSVNDGMTGQTLYGLLFRSDNKVLRISDVTFVTWSDANVGDYDIALTESPVCRWTGSVSDLPACAVSDSYSLEVWQRVGNAPTRSDDYFLAASGGFNWDGTRDVFDYAIYSDAENIHSDLATVATAVTAIHSDVDLIHTDVDAIKTKTDTIPSVLSVTQPNLDQSVYEVAQYSTPTLTFTVRDSLGAVVDLTGKSLSLDVRRGWHEAQLFSKASSDFTTTYASDGQASVTLVASDTSWDRRVREDTLFQAELFQSSTTELGRFLLMLKPSHLNAP